MKTLRPIAHKDAYTVAIEEKVRAYFEETIFGPLREMLEQAKVPDADRINAVTSALRSALESARIWYADGAFYGSFSASISRELRGLGATFDARDSSFRFPQGKLPIDLQDVVFRSIDRSRDVHAQVIEFLDEAQANIAIAATGIEVEVALSRIRGDLYKQLEMSLSAETTALEFVEVSADVTPFVSQVIATEFRENLDLYIKNFLATEIPELRAEVAANAFAGYRADRLAKLIEARYGVSKRKAAFLADQETSLFVSKFREARYREIGVRSYKWSTSHDDRVRRDHKLLDGTVHSWESPPITNRTTGARNHPGEDYRCRCVPIAILTTATVENSRSVFRCVKRAA